MRRHSSLLEISNLHVDWKVFFTFQKFTLPRFEFGTIVEIRSLFKYLTLADVSLLFCAYEPVDRLHVI